MANPTGNSDLSTKNLNLTSEEKRVFRQLFQQADTEGLEVVTGEQAVKFFEKTNVPAPVLGEIWQIADTENRGLLTPSGFSIALRLIGHYQAGKELTPELAYRAGPLPKFDGINAGLKAPPTNALPPPSPLQAQSSGGPIRVPALLPERASEYASLFARSGPQNGTLPGESAKQIFEKARLPIEVLGQIWNLADTERRGMLDVTEFIIAMHLIASYKSGAMRALPQILPPGLYEAASRRGGPSSGRAAIPRQFTGASVRPPQSPISQPSQSTPPPQSPQTLGSEWLISSQEKARFDSFFATLDTEGRGYITGDQAVGFFSNSGLPEDTLAQIWDLADIKSEGQLNRDEFAVAMYLIWQQRSKGGPVPSTLPPGLVPPSMRNQTLPSPKPTAPTFDNTTFGPQQPKSAAEDLFGLDALSTATPEQAPQPTGGSTVYSNSAQHGQLASSKVTPPTSTQGLPPAERSPATVFKLFMPTSSFGQSLTPQTTGMSQTSNRAPPITTALQPDDLLGDTDPEVNGKLTQETAELANMSNQIGTLRNQMQEVQGKKAVRGEELSKTTTHRRELEQRLTQFRTQYEQEVKEIKSLEEQLAASRNSTQKLSQDLAMLEGIHQDLQSKYREIAAALEADRRENAGLKERIRQINEEVYALKPQLEKLKSEARQQKGMTAINRKQLATNEAEKNRLQQEIDDLTRDAEERAAEARAAEAQAAEARAAEARAAEARAAEARAAEARAAEARAADATAAEARAAEVRVAEESAKSVRAQPGDLGSSGPSPTASAASHGTNPFFRKSPPPPENAMSPGGFARELPLSQQNQASFDSIFGPSFSTPLPTGPPPTSFKSEPHSDFSGPSEQSVRSSEGPEVATPSTSPPSSSSQESPHTAEPPPPPESRQNSSSALPVEDNTQRSDSFASSTKASAPATRHGPSEMDTPMDAASNKDSAKAGAMGLERTDTIRPQARGSGPGPTPHHNTGSSTASSVSDYDRPEADSDEPTTPVIDAIEESIPGAFPGETGLSQQATPTGASTASSRESEDRRPAYADPFSVSSDRQPTTTAALDDSETAFAGYGNSQPSREIPRAGEASANGSARNASKSGEEFPPIRDLGGGDESDSDDDNGGFADNFASSHKSAERTGESQMQGVDMPHNQADMGLETPATPNLATTSARQHTGEQLPPSNTQKSPPTYEQTVSLTDPPRDANQFPPEFSGLLPSREVPTSPPSRPMESSSVQDVQTDVKAIYAPPPMSQPVFTSGPTPLVGQQASSVVRDFPWLRYASQPAVQPAQTSSGDDFDAAFDDLEEAQADKGDEDFTLVSSQHVDEFNATFDTPASTAAFPLQSDHSPFDPQSNLAHNHDSFNGFEANPGSPKQTYGSGMAQLQPTASTSHDWDAIFSGLDNPQSSQHGEHQSSAGMSPFHVRHEERNISQTGPSPKAAPPQLGRALSSGTEHDDPILKRLTGMGYARGDALAALEKFDYNIDKAADYLTSTH